MLQYFWCLGLVACLILWVLGSVVMSVWGCLRLWACLERVWGLERCLHGAPSKLQEGDQALVVKLPCSCFCNKHEDLGFRV